MKYLVVATLAPGIDNVRQAFECKQLAEGGLGPIGGAVGLAEVVDQDGRVRMALGDLAEVGKLRDEKLQLSSLVIDIEPMHQVLKASRAKL